MNSVEPKAPLPWAYSPERHTGDFMVHSASPATSASGYIDDKDGVIGSSEWTWLNERDAAYIIQCCNNFPKAQALYDALVEARKFIVRNSSYSDSVRAVALDNVDKAISDWDG
jgi:hypothetical protein